MSYQFTDPFLGGVSLRKPNEGEFQAVLPSGLPMRFAVEVYTLSVQDAYNANVSEAEVGYLSGPDPVWQDGDVTFKDEDVLWSEHGASGETYTLVVADCYHVNAGQTAEAGYITGADPVWQDTADTAFQDEDVVFEPHGDSTGNASTNAVGHQLDADVGTATLSGVAAYTASGDVGQADVGAVVASGAGAVSASGDVGTIDGGTTAAAGAALIVTGSDVGAADVGSAVLAGVAAYSASGDQMAADVGSVTAAGETVYLLADLDSYVATVSGSPDLAQSGDIVANASGDELAANVGTTTLSGQAQTSATGDGLAADVGTPTIGGAGIAAPGGDVGQADVGSAATAGVASVSASGDELTADVGDVAVSTQYILDIYDAANVNAADAPTLSLQNGEAFPAGVEADADAGTAVASAPSIVVPVAPRGGRRRPVQWALWEQPKEPEAPEPSISAVAYPMGVAAQSAMGTPAVNAASNIIPLADFGRSRVGVVSASVDYTLRDKQEEELIQILLAA